MIADAKFKNFHSFTLCTLHVLFSQSPTLTNVLSFSLFYAPYLLTFFKPGS